MQLRIGDDSLAITDSTNILVVEIDSKLGYCHHLENIAPNSSLRLVTRVRRARYLLDTDGPLRLCKAKVRSVMEYSPSHG